MSGHNLDRTLPPGDRDDAPAFDLGEAIRGTPLAPEAPTLTDDTTAARIARLIPFVTEANKALMESLRLLSAGHRADARSAMDRCSKLLTEAAPLARLLANPPATRAKE